jgi:hypothetical protein
MDARVDMCQMLVATAQAQLPSAKQMASYVTMLLARHRHRDTLRTFL